ncbi:MAG: peptidoglycan DD-metalloendopeptidase family protein, partial [Eubacterium sp.]|nr:peptidoglycan DD-metalloendopeptidase family protein [Eubacterium sp.]
SKIQRQIDSAEKEISKLSSEKKETQEYIAALDKKIQLKQDQINILQSDADNLQSEINAVEKSIGTTEEQIVKTQKEIDIKQAQFDKTFDEYCQRLRAMYVSGHASNLEVLLTSSDISSILTRSEMIKSVSEQDSEILDSLMTQMEEIEKEKAALEKKINKLNKDKKQLKEDKKALTDRISTIAASKKELDNEVAECNALIKKLSSQSAEYQEAIEENESALAKVEAEIQAAYARASRTGSSGGSTGSGTHSGALRYPTDYHSISAGYPNYSSGRYHGGVDFPCPSGSSVYAAASGTVIAAYNLNYSYGHYLIVDHGNGLSTLYAHNTTLLVGVGDHVNKGQVIARSGSTGNSTGPHCHFEVRVNGTRVNPMNYL